MSNLAGLAPIDTACAMMAHFSASWSNESEISSFKAVLAGIVRVWRRVWSDRSFDPAFIGCFLDAIMPLLCHEFVASIVGMDAVRGELVLFDDSHVHEHNVFPGPTRDERVHHGIVCSYAGALPGISGSNKLSKK